MQSIYINFINNSSILQPIDKRLVRKIEALVGEEVKTVGEMKRYLHQYVKHELFNGEKSPGKSNRRYYLGNVDIRNHMYRATVKHMLSKIDQENLEKKLKSGRYTALNTQFIFDLAPYHQKTKTRLQKMRKMMLIQKFPIRIPIRNSYRKSYRKFGPIS